MTGKDLSRVAVRRNIRPRGQYIYSYSYIRETRVKKKIQKKKYKKRVRRINRKKRNRNKRRRERRGRQRKNAVVSCDDRWSFRVSVFSDDFTDFNFEFIV